MPAISSVAIVATPNRHKIACFDAPLSVSMPGSFTVFDTLSRQLVQWIAPQRVVDFGAGAGKYGSLLRGAAPGCRTVAVEPQSRYVEQFGLRALYDEVHVEAADQWMANHLDSAFDLAILGDCLTHMPKSVGLDLLNALAYRAAYTLVVVPEFIVQGSVDGVAGEAHVSVWSERDLHWHDLWAWDNCRTTSFFLLRGYLPAPVPLADLVQRVNASQLPVHEFHDPASFVRPARLRLVEHPRETLYRPA
ncbi:MAG: class I SAM-dependent methyltransferase [Proteobacteria bacterium]|jgi:hypothetical protein|nr:class I SAM-dependent methyltransferase [Burkholderiaceae bacterium]MCH8855496.1 class I SAM-dependent methyltransferase [Pseudomonadota bacterium]|mmetsp:Transcript_42578/g.75314  ORF Transcript_42578/g.75314 Transcript_42578/m.75314 type:complete len:248 (-) Transcript_42578:661-1404(-)